MDFFKTLIALRECDSTMNFARKISNFVEMPFIVTSEIQTEGRGQYRRKWSSPLGGLWITEVFGVENPVGLSTFMSIPIFRLIKRYSGDVSIKWPNDIFIKGRKVAGIITEIVGNTAYVGIGINVENRVPEELNAIATSLSEHVKIKKELLLYELIKEEENLIGIFMKRGFSEFKEEYSKNLILLNKVIKIASQKKYVGVVTGITDRGELVVKTTQESVIISQGTILSIDLT